MNPNLKLLQSVPAVMTKAPADINGAGLAGVYIAAKFNTRFALLLALGAVGADTTFVVKQAKDADGTGAKAITLVAGQVFSGAAGDMLAQDDAAISAGNVAATAAGYANKTVLVDIPTEALDRANGFGYVGVTAASPGADTIVGVVALPYGIQRYASANDGAPDVTV